MSKDSFFNSVVGSYEDTEYTEDLVLKFNGWFSNQLCKTVRKNGAFFSVASDIVEVARQITVDELNLICDITEWDRDIIFNTDKRNVVYWYALNLLYLYNDSVVEDDKCGFVDGCLFDYDALYLFLDSLTPFVGEED